MSFTKEDLLKLATVRTESVKLECLKGTSLEDMDFLLKEMTISQNNKYLEFVQSEDSAGAIKFACSSVMINPTYFTDEEIYNLNGLGNQITNEIFNKIPTIGMSNAEKEEFLEKIKKYLENQNEEKIEIIKEDKKKKL